MNPQDYFFPAGFTAASELPWIPAATPGKWSKPLRFLPDNAGFVELLKMAPGAVMPLHRHSGAVHAYNLSGTRRLCTGEIIGPGDYVYEPPGNTDWWEIVGDATMVAMVVVMGAVEFLGPGGVVTGRADAASMRAEYERFCGKQRLPVLSL